MKHFGNALCVSLSIYIHGIKLSLVELGCLFVHEELSCGLE